MAAGWEFQKGNYMVLVAEPDIAKAKAVAVAHFKGEPDRTPREIPQGVLDFLELKPGGKTTAGVFQSWST